MKLTYVFPDYNYWYSIYNDEDLIDHIIERYEIPNGDYDDYDDTQNLLKKYKYLINHSEYGEVYIPEDIIEDKFILSIVILEDRKILIKHEKKKGLIRYLHIRFNSCCEYFYDELNHEKYKKRADELIQENNIVGLITIKIKNKELSHQYEFHE